jgi:hypothetical protein
MPQLIAYAGYIPYNQSQTCVILSQLVAGFFTQFYLRNYRPRIFKDYSYLITGAWDGASSQCSVLLEAPSLSRKQSCLSQPLLVYANT